MPVQQQTLTKPGQGLKMDYGFKEHCLKVCQKMNLQTVLDMRLVGAHICSKLVIPANSGGIGPDIWFSSLSAHLTYQAPGACTQ